MANIPGSVRLTGFIAPTDSTDTFPVTDPTWGLGGLRRVSGTTERDLISTGRRESGMLVYSEDDDNYYKLGTGLTNSDWTVFMTGGGSGNFLSLSGGTVTGVTEFTAGLVSNEFSGGTFYSGGTDLYDIFSTNDDITRVSGGANISTGGTANNPIINLDADIILTSVNATTLSGGTIFSGGTDLYDIFLTSAQSALTGNTNETLRFNLSGNPESSEILLNDGSSLTATTTFTVGTRSGATGINSFVHGENNIASGDYSKAGGFQNVASGFGAVADGYETVSSAILSRTDGFDTIASGDYSWAMGYETEATGWGSVSMGYLTKSKGAFLSFATGWGSEANGDQSFAGGNFSKALGDNSIAFGFETTAHTLSTDGQSVANTMATGWQSQAFGWGSTARGLQSTALSQGAVAEGSGSIAGRIQGGGLPGSGRYARAQNYFTWAYGDNSHAGGGGVYGGPFVYATGTNSFNHSSVTAGYASSGASAANSVILGGTNHVVESSALRSAIFGGASITATTADTVYVPNLNINTIPSNDNALTQILARDTDGTIKYVDSSVFAGSGATGGDYLPLSGGTVTGDSQFTQTLSADTIDLTSTTAAQITMAPVNAAAPADGSMWFTTSGGTTFLNYRVTGTTKSVELS